MCEISPLNKLSQDVLNIIFRLLTSTKFLASKRITYFKKHTAFEQR